MKLVTTAEMQALEQAANAAPGYATMMENAGRATALAIREEIPATSARVLVLVEPGNNGEMDWLPLIIWRSGAIRLPRTCGNGRKSRTPTWNGYSSRGSRCCGPRTMRDSSG